MPPERHSTSPSIPAADATAAESRAALLRGDRHTARRLAFEALGLDRTCDLAWLVLAALSPAGRRRAYLEHAARVCPGSARLRKALAETQPLAQPQAATPSSGRIPTSQPALPTPPPVAVESQASSARAPWAAVGRIALRRLGTSLLVLVAIAYLAAFGLLMARRGQAGLPAEPASALAEAVRQVIDYVVHHPATYYMAKQDQPWWSVAGTAFLRSAALLFLSLAVATMLGTPLGVWAATRKRRSGSALIITISILGVSTPSFLLAMLFWIADFKIYRLTGTSPFPPTGFGWDLHMVMPVLVLATRPMAQVAQVTYVTLSDALSQDYMRTALGKGLSRAGAVWQHALRNVWIPVLTAIGTSLRFSLASLPVVESFFLWPGLGLLLLTALDQGLDSLILDLLLGLGLLFLAINSLLDVVYPLLDPRLRQDALQEERRERVSPHDRLLEAGDALRDILRGFELRVRTWLPRRRPVERPSVPRRALAAPLGATSEAPALILPTGRLRRGVMLLVSNPAFVIGSLLLLGLLVLSIAGGSFTAASAYETHGIIMINGELASPPFDPSPSYPWGSDAIGRDIQALVLEGARRTMALAVIATLARLLLGTTLGVIAGWWQRGWMDRLLSAGVAIWAAFPVTLFAMILIYGMGIQQGFWIFVLALCVVGWGEIAQFVRGLVIRLKGQPFVEGARAVGARADQILLTQILPNMTAPLLVAASLETAGVLMLLAELGFLNVFMGGGFRAMIGETGRMSPVIYYFSDVPEWSALLANIRNWWRSYPWLGWYPGVAFFLAIIAFNLWGEGLRRFLDDTRINLSRLLNRNLLLIGSAAAVIVALILNAVAPSSQYRDAAANFDAAAVQADISALASPTAEGRETGMPGARIAAEYIARRMADIGLQPAGVGNTFLQTLVRPRFHLTAVPQLDILDAAGNVQTSLIYRRDFSEFPYYPGSFWTYSGFLDVPQPILSAPVFGCTVGAGTDLGEQKLPPPQGEGIVIALEGSNCPSASDELMISLIVPQDPGAVERKSLFPQTSYRPPELDRTLRPLLYISRQAADALLATAGSSLAELEAMRDSLPRGSMGITDPGATVRIRLEGRDEDPEASDYIHVLGFIPGTGALSQQSEGRGLDQQVIIVSAYYDGLGVMPDGVLYPGANDNASGVAMMLEMARQLVASPYQPKKTVMFVAWAGGERREGLSVVEIMNAKVGFASLTPEVVIELSGVGAGTMDQAAIGEGSSFRLIQLFQDAAAEFDLKTTTRGRGPHFTIPAYAGFGGRSATTLALSWDGADATAHSPQDTPESIDPAKLERLGRSALLTLLILSRETVY